jgi:hypothetical protein
MGRCNRDTSRMKSRPLGRVFVVRPEEGREKPYKKPDLETAARFVDSIAGRACSQDDLERAYQEHDISEVEPGKICPFFDSGAFAQAREESFRDIDEFTVPSVLDHDVERARSLLKDRKPIDGLIVPVPRFLAVAAEPETGLPRWLSIASGHRYDRLAGFDGRMRPDSDTSTSGDAS